MSKLKTDSDLVRIARQMQAHFDAIRSILYDIAEAEYPGKQTFLADLNDNGLTAFAWPDHIVYHALIHPERWQTYCEGIRYMGIGKEFEPHLGHGS